MSAHVLVPGMMSLAQMRAIWSGDAPLALDPGAYDAIDSARAAVAAIVEDGRTVYGVNTGFGLLAHTRIANEELSRLQENLILSHACGVGEPLPDRVVRLIIALKVASLARGHSGVRREVVDALLVLANAQAYPVIPAKGSVGASGDLAPLAHLCAPLIGVGLIRSDGRDLPAVDALASIGLEPLTLAPKEGLALINGTQVSTALALDALFRLEHAFAAGIAAGALSVDAYKGSTIPFDARVQAVRGLAGQADVASSLRGLLADSEINASHGNCQRVQDPYSFRCQAQVMGAALDVMRAAAATLETEANAVTDNPLVFPDESDIISGGNFHAQPVAFAADMLCMAACEIGSVSERRLAILVDPKMSGLPAFLVAEPGLNSGFMIAQVTAAALVSENKTLAHPASVDSIPTSANQEDHVSMATFAARKTGEVVENLQNIIAIELLAASQGVEMHAPLKTSAALQNVLAQVRAVAAYYDADRYFADDIAATRAVVNEGAFLWAAQGALPSQAGP